MEYIHSRPAALSGTPIPTYAISNTIACVTTAQKTNVRRRLNWRSKWNGKQAAVLRCPLTLRQASHRLLLQTGRKCFLSQSHRSLSAFETNEKLYLAAVLFLRAIQVIQNAPGFIDRAGGQGSSSPFSHPGPANRAMGT